MIDIQFDRNDLNTFAQYANGANRISLITHVGPDGDTVGSVLGLASILRAVYPEVKIYTIVPDTVPNYLNFIPGFDSLICYEETPEKTVEAIRSSELIGCIDFNTKRRMQYEEMQKAVSDSQAHCFMIDHHPYPENSSFDLIFSYTQVSSTAELMYYWVRAMGWEKHIGKEAAEALLCGIITDTGCFMHNSSRAETYGAVMGLIKSGADKAAVINALFHRSRESQIRLKGFVLNEKMTLLKDKKAAYITLNKKELSSFHAEKGDTEGFVNIPLDIDGIRCSCLIREDEDQIKISLRSLNDFPVNGIATRAFGGGGHINAAGAEYNGTLEEALAIFLRELDVENEIYDRKKNIKNE
ncbi:DHH family phosphoesterase [Porphyromonas macacae]|uniref:DHH family phosphoesterase n=1 Tax=Porphyromonas macacae TaxID=28115 RepID=UPI0024ACEBB9|nr:bifunctional oligoribonuclease/PAP phosphatase NrnA [Porphyromonas macacae]